MKKYIIIGATSGIGLATVKLLENNNTVFGTFNKNSPPNHTKSSFHQIDSLDENLNFDFLPESIDGIVYCPGNINLKPFHRIKPKTFIEDYNLQVVGAIKVIQTLLPRLKKSEQASIVLFSTVAVQKGYNFHSLVAASKGAIEGITRSLAAEWAPKIRINCIAPSLTDTPLAARLLNTDEKRIANANRHPLGRIGQPNDIAEMVCFLLSEKSSWMTGQILHIDGGMSSINS